MELLKVRCRSSRLQPSITADSIINTSKEWRCGVRGDLSLDPVCRELRPDPPLIRLKHMHHHRLSAVFFYPHLGFLAFIGGLPFALRSEVRGYSLTHTSTHTNRAQNVADGKGWPDGRRTDGEEEEEEEKQVCRTLCR